MELQPIESQRFDIGKCAIFYRETPWAGTTDLFGELVHIGTTEGEVNIEANAEYSELTLPEVSGPAALKRYLAGERPQFTIGVFPDPDKLKLFSPTNTGSAGQQLRRRTAERTLWVVPQELFLAADPVTGRVSPVVVTYDGTEFLKAGESLSAADQELVNMSMLIWKADFERVTPRFQHDEGGKSLQEVTVNILQDFTKPDGCQLYLMMAEADEFEIDFTGAGS